MLDGPVGYSRVQILFFLFFLKYQGVGLEAKYKILWSPRAAVASVAGVCLLIHKAVLLAYGPF